MRQARPADGVTDTDKSADHAAGDRACVGFAIAAGVLWLGTAATESLVLGLLTIASMAALSGVAAYTSVAGPASGPRGRLVGGMAAVAAVTMFVLTVEAAWSWAIPAVALAVGLHRARSPRLRLGALAITGAVLVAAWIAGVGGG